MNSTYMKFNPQATLKWAAQRMHSKVIRLVMHNANTLAVASLYPGVPASLAMFDDLRSKVVSFY